MPERRIRQGEISLHTLIIYLGRYIHFISTKNNPRVGKSTKDNPKGPYLIFVDDCLIFYRAIKQAASEVTHILE